MLLDGRSLRIQKGRTDARYVGAGNWLRAVAAEDYNAAEADSEQTGCGWAQAWVMVILLVYRNARGVHRTLTLGSARHELSYPTAG